MNFLMSGYFGVSKMTVAKKRSNNGQVCRKYRSVWIKVTLEAIQTRSIMDEINPNMTRKLPKNGYFAILKGFWGWLEPYCDDVDIDHEFWN